MSGRNGVPIIWITNFRDWNVTLKIGSLVFIQTLREVL